MVQNFSKLPSEWAKERERTLDLDHSLPTHATVCGMHGTLRLICCGLRHIKIVSTARHTAHPVKRLRGTTRLKSSRLIEVRFFNCWLPQYLCHIMTGSSQLMLLWVIALSRRGECLRMMLCLRGARQMVMLPWLTGTHGSVYWPARWEGAGSQRPLQKKWRLVKTLPPTLPHAHPLPSQLIVS